MATVRKPNTKPSFFKQTVAELKAKASEQLHKEVFMVSFRHVDRNQGQRFNEWEAAQLLAHAIETVCGYSSASLHSQLHDRFKIYGGFPPPDKTDFSHPSQVPPDAQWACMHIAGEPCLIGHVVDNTFFLVFLDQHHKFWKSELKHT